MRRRLRTGFLLAASLGLGACALLPGQDPEPVEPPGPPPVPASVLAAAAPNQNLGSVRLRPEDGCFWYLHNGPVEETLLPLRSRTGSRFCVQGAT